MKCPKCKYTSFDNLTSCKKCGFVFESSGDSESIFSPESPVSESDIENENVIQERKPDKLSKTVASIKESLDEIEAGEAVDTGNTTLDRMDPVESDSMQLQVNEKTVNENEVFPTRGEINWDESISISSADLNLDTFDFSDEKGEIKFDAERSEITYEKTEKFKKEMEMIGKELTQIDEEPTKDEPSHPSELSCDINDFSRVRKGGFWIRFSAFIIDNVVLYILAFILSIIGIIALGLGSPGLEEIGEEEIYSLILPLYIFNTILTIAYYTYFHGSTGQTPGKMLCKLKVVRVNGEPLGYGKAFLRWVGYMLSGLVFCLGFLWAGWDKNKQAWHDKIVGTYVVRT